MTNKPENRARTDNEARFAVHQPVHRVLYRGRALLDSPLVPMLAVALFAVFVGLWFVLPRLLVAGER